MNNQNTAEIIKGNDKILKEYLELFAETQKPIEVNFRKLFPELKRNDRYTHSIHTYPAKLMVTIPYFFLNNSICSKEGDIVLDPFCGSGTVLLEGLLANRNVYGADANPLARLIAEVKIKRFNNNLLLENLKKVVVNAKRAKPVIPEVVNREFWFSKSISLKLGKILSAILKIKNRSVKKFMLVSFSNCVKKVSYADQRVSVPVKMNPARYKKGSEQRKLISKKLRGLRNIDVHKKFEQTTKENIKRMQSLNGNTTNNVNGKIISKDARKLTRNLSTNNRMPANSINLILTSPPYAGAQKYIRASSLNLGWTGLSSIADLKKLDKKNIGRENYKYNELSVKNTGLKEADDLIGQIFNKNPTRAVIVCNYLIELKEAIDEMIRVLKKDGHLILILGNNKVCNQEFNTQEYVTEYIISQGLNLRLKLIDDIKSYGLMTKRNKTADIISREWILVFKK